jgi:hypothetical protein
VNTTVVIALYRSLHWISSLIQVLPSLHTGVGISVYFSTTDLVNFSPIRCAKHRMLLVLRFFMSVIRKKEIKIVDCLFYITKIYNILYINKKKNKMFFVIAILCRFGHDFVRQFPLQLLANDNHWNIWQQKS